MIITFTRDPTIVRPLNCLSSASAANNILSMVYMNIRSIKNNSSLWRVVTTIFSDDYDLYITRPINRLGDVNITWSNKATKTKHVSIN